MEGESGFTRTKIDELHSSDIQRDEMEAEISFARRIIHELHSWHIRGRQMEGESMVLP